eukprot:scaffold202424_cov14-Tisochrysis_lutea.AAC.2
MQWRRCRRRRNLRSAWRRTRLVALRQEHDGSGDDRAERSKDRGGPPLRDGKDAEDWLPKYWAQEAGAAAVAAVRGVSVVLARSYSHEMEARARRRRM